MREDTPQSKRRSTKWATWLATSLLLTACTVIGSEQACARTTVPDALQVQAAATPTPTYEDGDIIFHQSQSRQSAALQEGTGSPWTHVGVLIAQRGKWFVAEASSKVTMTPIKDFIDRGKGRRYVVKRLKKSVGNVDAQALTRELSAMMKTPYDIYFEWSDDSIYCSELVYKAYDRAMNMRIGTIQKFRDMRLDGPYVQKLIQERITNTGREMNLDEPIITPISMMTSSKLETIGDQSGSQRP